MNREQNETRVFVPKWTRLAAAYVLAMMTGLIGVSIFVGDWKEGQAPFPFVWRDVAIVYLICALPLAATVTPAFRRTIPPAPLIAVAALMCALGILPDVAQRWFVSGTTYSMIGGMILRTYAAYTWALALTLLGAIVFDNGRATGRRHDILLTSVAVGVLALVPAFYVAARCRHDSRVLSELLGQQRIGEALTLASNVRTVDKSLRVNGKEVTDLITELSLHVRRLELKIEFSPIPITAEERLERSRDLAMLGRTDAALDVLSPITDAAADNLRGTIYEARGEWDDGRAAYERAVVAIASQPRSDARDAALQRALAGVAYCQRKAGRYDLAAVAYLKLLDHAPTADTHFLLAQFYEDAQDASKAYQHAQRAMALAPSRYREQGENLIRKLRVSQFGCLRAL